MSAGWLGRGNRNAAAAAPAFAAAAATTGTGHSDILNFTFGFGVASLVRWAARKRRAARTKANKSALSRCLPPVLCLPIFTLSEGNGPWMSNYVT